MASPAADSFGDVITISSSEDESEPRPSRKRPLEDVDDSRVSNISHQHLKRSRIEPTTIDSGDKSSPVSEEGQINEGDSHSILGAKNSLAESQPMNMDGGNEGAGGHIGSGASTEEASSKPNTRPSGVSSSNGGPSFTHNSLTFELPALSNKMKGAWQTRIEKWTKLFLDRNPSLLYAMTHELVIAAFCHYVANIEMKGSTKAKARRVARQLERNGSLKRLLPDRQEAEFSTNEASVNGSTAKQPRQLDSIISLSDGEDDEDDEVEYEPTQEGPKLPTDALLASSGVPDASQNTSAEGNGAPQAAANAAGSIMSINDLSKLRRYFPSANGSTNLCLSCGMAGHVSANCTYGTCKFCNKNGHWHYKCPTRARCGKCRQLGHSKVDCTEKLALTKEEGLACSFCNSARHLEDDCTEIWRSFRPTAETIKTVVAINPSCSLCGSDRHFSADCRDQSGYTENPTWSLQNCNRYTNPECGILSIEQASAVATGQSNSHGGGELKIRGKATRTTHVHYSESEDSELEFLGHHTVQKKPNVGTIRMASNIQIPKLTRGQPPLPPGPPPSGPATHTMRGHGLPPKPPSRDHRTNGAPSFPPPGPQGAPPPSWQDRNANSSQYPRADRFKGGQRGGGRGNRGSRGGRGRGGRGRGF